MAREDERRPREVRLSFPSDLEFLPLLNTVVEEVLRLGGADEETTDSVANAVIEAGTNAAQYGPEDSRVDVEIRLEAGEVDIVVKDRGPGFDPDRVSDVDEATASMALRGRGVLIMKALMDEVHFEGREGGGSTVRMTKRLEG